MQKKQMAITSSGTHLIGIFVAKKQPGQLDQAGTQEEVGTLGRYLISKEPSARNVSIGHLLVW